MLIEKPMDKGKVLTRVGIVLGLVDRSDEVVDGTSRDRTVRTVGREETGRRSTVQRGPVVYDTSMNTSMSVWIDQMTICSMSVFRFRNDSPVIPRPLHNSATGRLTTLPLELINNQRDMSVAGYQNAKYLP